MIKWKKIDISIKTNHQKMYFQQTSNNIFKHYTTFYYVLLFHDIVTQIPWQMSVMHRVSLGRISSLIVFITPSASKLRIPWYHWPIIQYMSWHETNFYVDLRINTSDCTLIPCSSATCHPRFHLHFLWIMP